MPHLNSGSRLFMVTTGHSPVEISPTCALLDAYDFWNQTTAMEHATNRRRIRQIKRRNVRRRNKGTSLT